MTHDTERLGGGFETPRHRERDLLAGVVEIVSPKNPRVKDWVRLRESKHRKRQERFLIEGKREIQRAISAGWNLLQFLPCMRFIKEPAQAVDSGRELNLVPKGVETVWLSEAVFRKLSLREHPDGFLAVARLPDQGLAKLKPIVGEAPLFLLLEGLEKPGNLGAIFRTADAAGVDAILLSDAAADPLGPHAIRASQGAVFSVPFACGSPEEVACWLRQKRVQLVATSPDAPLCLWEADLLGPTCLLFGTEAEGLSDFWLQDPATSAVHLPMLGQADSLNVAATAAIALFEARRQRFLASSRNMVFPVTSANGDIG